jgi:uncharacterized protein
MFEHPLPLTIKPLKLARHQGKLKGFLPLEQLPTLVADCLDSAGRLEADLQLEMQGRWPVLTGVASATLPMTCQRCLAPVQVPVKAQIALGFAQTEESLGDLPEHLEPFLLDEEEIRLADLLEQELILALPIVPYHPECELAPYQSGEEEAAIEEEKPNPFKVLEQLKGNLKKSDQ